MNIFSHQSESVNFVNFIKYVFMLQSMHQLPFDLEICFL